MFCTFTYVAHTGSLGYLWYHVSIHLLYIYMYREAIQFKLSLYLKKVGLASRNIVHH